MQFCLLDLLLVEIPRRQRVAGGVEMGDRSRHSARTAPPLRERHSSMPSWVRTGSHASNKEYDNAFKIQWELFLRHIVLNEPFRWTLLEGVKGIQLADRGLQSSAEQKWIDIEPLKV